VENAPPSPNAQMLRHALPRLPAALARVNFPRLVSHLARTAHRPRRLPSSSRIERGGTSLPQPQPGCRCKSPWADRGCLPVSDGDGDGAMVVTAFTAPSGLRASTRSRCRSRCSQEIFIEADGGAVVSVSREPDSSGDARRARNFRGIPPHSRPSS